MPRGYLVLWLLTLAATKVVIYQGKSDDSSLSTELSNAQLLNETLQNLSPGDRFIIPNESFWVMGGIGAADLADVVIQLDGTLSFSQDIDNWPTYSNGQVYECLQFANLRNVTFTSSGVGLLNGNGAPWWGVPFLGYAIRGENRPRLLNIGGSSDLVVENLFFLNSPYWTVWIHEVDGLVIRHSTVQAKRDNYDGHDWDDLSAFNTDGFDVSGR